VVPVLKNTGAVHLCGDYKLTLNKAARVDKYPIPNTKYLYDKLAGGKVYTKLDLSEAYSQVEIKEQSQLLTTINTLRDSLPLQDYPMVSLQLLEYSST